ncbi:magnesium-translocating P-type ATPase [Nocardia otitidiscaviarum]|uniref:magnesium-translocating P-type ATPase n=1 Tax=Nocardia otitidiscaviarum TaxID=1823 RepID=UPI002456FBBE|nr:magnesium-translocating P-type ATPase [Nocardia otitidiscaviarum]
MTMSTPLSLQRPEPPTHRPSRRERRAAELEDRTRAVGAKLVGISARPAKQVLHDLDSVRAGLDHADADQRLAQYGPNKIAHEYVPHWLVQLVRAFGNPFILVLAGLAVVLCLTGDAEGVITIGIMITISTLIRFWQEFRSNRAAEALARLVTTTATVVRRDAGAPRGRAREIPMADVVPGDIVHLAAGDLVPADMRLIAAKDLMVAQAALTGESLPVEKADTTTGDTRQHTRPDPADADNLVLMGTSVTSGTGTGVVVATGSDTYFGSMADIMVGAHPETAFDIGVKRVAYLLIRFMLVMVPVVFVVNGWNQGDWTSAFLFAVAVAVGLTPEMLPVVVTANLAKGAVAMSKRKVVVKRLSAIQNLGGMDVLCTDKTGTLTEDRVVLDRYLDMHGRPSDEVLRLAYLNSHFQTGLRNLLDRAVIDRMDEAEEVVVDSRYRLADEIPFDFVRRRISVVVSDRLDGLAENQLVCKGAVEEVVALCRFARDGDREIAMSPELRERVIDVAERTNREGLRVVAVATRAVPIRDRYTATDETELTLVGFLAFLDPPKQDAAAALKALADNGVEVKVITGDSELVAARVCAGVGLAVGEPVTGTRLELTDDADLPELVERTTLFAKIDPTQKARIVRTLHARGHTVGFLGDGINDAAALREADVGISVDTAVDIARESADIILLEKDLMVLERGVIEGRRTFGNTMKYIKMTASSNFGNVFSVLVASAFLPFQPMLAVHLLVQNLLYDISQLSIPWDRMDEEYLREPQQWNARDLGRFMLCIGPTSSIFDMSTFALMWFVFQANSPEHQTLFQSGWFIEGLLSQTLIVHMIRTRKVPFLQSRAALPVLLTTGTIMAVGIWLPFSPLADVLRMQALPLAYFPWLVLTLLSYCLVAQLAKTLYIRKFGSWL